MPTSAYSTAKSKATIIIYHNCEHSNRSYIDILMLYNQNLLRSYRMFASPIESRVATCKVVVKLFSITKRYKLY